MHHTIKEKDIMFIKKKKSYLIINKRQCKSQLQDKFTSFRHLDESPKKIIKDIKETKWRTHGQQTPFFPTHVSLPFPFFFFKKNHSQQTLFVLPKKSKKAPTFLSFYISFYFLTPPYCQPLLTKVFLFRMEKLPAFLPYKNGPSQQIRQLTSLNKFANLRMLNQRYVLK